MPDDAQLCTFTVGDLYLGIGVRHVQEVIRSLAMTRVPLAPDAVRGLINLRGQIVTAIDLRVRLGCPPRADDREPMHVVVRTDGGVVSLLVDEIDDPRDVSPEHVERAPETRSADARALVQGIHTLPDRLLLVLDVARVVHLDSATV